MDERGLLLLLSMRRLCLQSPLPFPSLLLIHGRCELTITIISVLTLKEHGHWLTNTTGSANNADLGIVLNRWSEERGGGRKKKMVGCKGNGVRAEKEREGSSVRS